MPAPAANAQVMSLQKARQEKEAPGDKLSTRLSSSFDSFHVFTLLDLTPCILPVFLPLCSIRDMATRP